MKAIHGETATAFQVLFKKYSAGWNNNLVTHQILTLKTIFQQI